MAKTLLETIYLLERAIKCLQCCVDDLRKSTDLFEDCGDIIALAYSREQESRIAKMQEEIETMEKRLLALKEKRKL